MFSIIIPIYNEAQNIPFLLEEISDNLKSYHNYEIILVNDSSTDNTNEVVKKIIKKDNLILLNNESNKGQSYSIHKGILKSKNNTIITLDGDGQNNPKDIPNLLNYYNLNEQIKLVGGIRSKRRDNLIKIISSRIANNIRSNILKDKCSDTGCSLKVFDKEIFLKFPFFNGIHRFLPALYSGFGFKTKFLNVDHRERKKGVSKYGTFDRLFKGIADIIKVRRIIIENKKNNAKLL